MLNISMDLSPDFQNIVGNSCGLTFVLKLAQVLLEMSYIKSLIYTQNKAEAVFDKYCVGPYLLPVIFWKVLALLTNVNKLVNRQKNM